MTVFSAVRNVLDSAKGVYELTHVSMPVAAKYKRWVYHRCHTRVWLVVDASRLARCWTSIIGRFLQGRVAASEMP